MPPKSSARSTAKSLGLTRYNSGLPCPQGHVSERMVSSGSCVQCLKARRKTPIGREQTNRSRRKYYWDDTERSARQTREYRKRNPDAVKATAKRRADAVKLWHQTHPEEIRQIQQRYRETAKGKFSRSENTRVRKERMTTQIPPCASLNKIRSMYRKAKKKSVETGILHVVDHIIPIDGDGVSGLHVEWNLQILTAIENLVKGDRYTP